ncbi:hypothetical protein KBD45_04655 [Candidatus Dojkabacteria bacterium]|nr:hypothetical protein [Candidatus Dojkabacteria bacterium]
MPSGIRNVIILLGVLTLVLVGVSIYVGLELQRKPSVDSDPVEASNSCGNNMCDDEESCDGINQCVGNSSYVIGDCRNSCTYCGDGITQSGEECDDGNDNTTDECNNSCRFADANVQDATPTPPTPTPSVEVSPVASPTPIQNSGTCGNSTCDTGESCDAQTRCSGSGNFDNASSCRLNCTYCGDSVVQVGEECDDGNVVDTDQCSNECQNSKDDAGSCGDGVIQDDEECDPGLSAICSNGNVCSDSTCVCMASNPVVLDEKVCGATCASNTDCRSDNVCEGGKCVILACSKTLGNLQGNINQSNNPATVCANDNCSVIQCGSACGANKSCPNGLTCNTQNQCVFTYCITNVCSNQCVLPETDLSGEDMKMILKALFLILLGLVVYQVIVFNNSFSILSTITGLPILKGFKKEEKLNKLKNRFESSF